MDPLKGAIEMNYQEQFGEQRRSVRPLGLVSGESEKQAAEVALGAAGAAGPRRSFGRDALLEYADSLRKEAAEVETLARALPLDISEGASMALYRFVNRSLPR